MSTITATNSGTYSIVPAHSRVGFVARHAMITKVRGAFNDIEGSGFFDAEQPSLSTLNVTIQTTSVDTRNADRDGHLRSDDFFAADTYPTLEYSSTTITPVDDSNFEVVGDLTIKGITRPVTLDLEMAGTAVDPWGNTRLGLEGSAVVNRKDWGLTWNTALDAGGVMVGDKITLEFEISAVKVTDE